MSARADDRPAALKPRIGVLLVNLGTPDAPTPGAVKTYLREFLSDPRVVEIPQFIWQPILRGVILNLRPRKSAHAYSLVWDRERNLSPLKAITQDQARELHAKFGQGVIVDHAMRYGTPSIAERLDALKTAGCDRVLIAPLYPQYCAATTATVVDEAGRALAGMRLQPAIRYLPPYYDDPAYIDALAGSVASALSALDFTPDTIIASFHGMPERTRTLGDPYYSQCLETARLLGDALGREVQISFQSRFGKARWLEPATDATLAHLPKSGMRSVAVLAPGFAADCLETLEELAIRGRESFLEAGGENFAYLPCLNASPDGLEMLQKLLLRELAGWVAET